VLFFFMILRVISLKIKMKSQTRGGKRPSLGGYCRIGYSNVGWFATK